MMPAPNGPRVPFLERLAPGATTVRAALPSRFAAEPSAWSGLPPAALAPHDESGSAHVAAAPPAPASKAGATSGQRQPAASPPVPRPGEQRPRVGPAEVASKAAAPHELLHAADAVSPQPPPSPVAVAPEIAMPLPKPARPVQPQRGVTTSTSPRAPLREASLPPRTQTGAEPPVVVHVSIDRIEVHAPATRTRAEPAPPKRRPATLPLADYLRQRKGGPA